jgi:ectoine hydroxylase-related dioxygenase (phytanoyl-CoA dioxygenase family)/SAM-dependent methyltransferase
MKNPCTPRIVDPPLSTTQVRKLHSDGFLVVQDVCDGAELALIRSVLMGLFEQQAGRAEGNQFDMLGLDRSGHDAIQPQILKPSLYAPALQGTAFFRRVQTMAEQLLGPGMRFSFDHSILKPAGKAAATPWHQDEAHGPDPQFHEAQLSFWMPLQDVDEVNGCMSYIPASHLGPLLAHRSVDGDPRIHAIECLSGTFDDRAALAQPAKAGTCILHDGRTLHCALANRSRADRLVYVLAFRGPAVPRPTPLQLAWLEGKRTARLERSRRWRNRGGSWVLLARRLRELRWSDPDTWGQPGQDLRKALYRTLWAPRLKAVLQALPLARRLYGGWTRPHPFDAAQGVDTSGFLPASECATGLVAAADISPYAGSQPSIVRASLALLPDLSRRAFVDIGCGKARPLVLASEFPFRRLLGVELSPALATVGCANAAVVARRHPERTAIEIIVGDAVALSARPGGMLGLSRADGADAAPDGVVYFMYHAFKRTLLVALIENLERQLRHDPRPVFFVYYNPVCGDVLDRSPLFARWSAATLPYASRELGHGPDIADTVVIWQGLPERLPARPAADRPIIVSALQWCSLGDVERTQDAPGP